MKIEEAIKNLSTYAYAELEKLPQDVVTALSLAQKALEKQIPKKPLYENKCDDCVVYSCPACKDEKLILDGDNYCTACGQALDWSDKS